ncbi:peroxisomal ATPase PEX1 isoform X1 [Nelusetta ayraudi]|uniref:peroxisomal ATPase PEX1 isoform X1 n=1 Tax=Nelusetta ayraudi TaxID=303726 RepID=UPI003F6EC55A
MFSSQGIQPVTVVFNNSKNCFIQLPLKLATHLSLTENQALELTWGHGSSVFLSWSPSRTSSSQDSHQVELCRQLGERLGLKDGEQGFLKSCHQVSSVHQVFVEPLTSDDWEILELHGAALEQQLLDQIRVVFTDAVFPVWVDSHTVIYIQIASLSPSVPYGRLEQFTELIVSPKIRDGLGGLGASVMKSSQKQFGGQQKVTRPPSAGPFFKSTSPLPQGRQWGGVADLKSLLRHMVHGEPVRELPAVPDIPDLLADSVYRVCAAPPNSLCTISQVTSAVVHIFPLSHQQEAGLAAAGQCSVTYGLLSKVPSPKESRDRLKKIAEKKKTKSSAGARADGGVSDGAEAEAKETLVVRVVCHCAARPAGERRHGRGDIHSGRVWVPPPLALRWNIVPHSTVRIKPVKSAIKVASSVRLQTLRALAEDNDEDIQTCFLDWLHGQSHEPLACLTPRSGDILLHGPDAKLEFAISVLRPEAEGDAADQLFLLTPAVIQKKDIQVAREPLADSATLPADEGLKPELPSLAGLGGVEELSQTAFSFISHSLLGSPLSRELGVTGRGLRGGALLITGAKGSGKSTLSRALCAKAREHLDAHVEIVDCKKLQGKRAETVRQTLQEVFEQAEWRQPAVVLLDDLDHVTGAAASPEHEHGPEAALQLHIAQSVKDVVDEAVLHSSLVCLLITSLSEHSLHPSLTEVQGSHLIQGFVHIQPPDLDQRADILRQLILRKSSQSEETLQTPDLAAVAKETEGYTAQDLALLLERAVHASVVHGGHSGTGAKDFPAVLRVFNKVVFHTDGLMAPPPPPPLPPPPPPAGVCLSCRDFEQALQGFTPPSLWGVDLHTPSGVGLERVGGLREVRQQLVDTVLLPAKYPVLFSNLPIRHRSGILLFGAPGTGKTLLARAVAKDSGMNFISIKGPELLSKYIGASEQGVRDVFQRAAAAKPCILFFDEFESLAPRRGHDSTGVTDRVVNQLLTQLDGVEGLQGVYVLAATSRPDLIDPALLRPGRLDKSLYCPPPDLKSRVEILKALSVGLVLDADVDLEQLAAATEQFTGADLKALLYNAQLEAVHRSMATGSPHELKSGSESDMSLSSMIFLNNSSASDDSMGYGEPGPGPGPGQSAVPPEPGELQLEEPPGNVWRLYFGSSYESEMGNSPGLRLTAALYCFCLLHDVAAAHLEWLRTELHEPRLHKSIGA